MKLKKGVFYKLFGEVTYVKDIVLQKEYLLNETAAVILNYLSENCEADIPSVYDHVKQVYGDAVTYTDIAEFIDALQDEQIIVECDVLQNDDGSVEDEIRAYCQQNKRLFSAVFEITYRCNEKCIHCYVDDKSKADEKRELTLPEYKSVIDHLASMGCMALLLTGGEVSVRNDYIDIAEYAIEKGILVDIYTNGLTMSDEDFDRLCELPLNSVSFSLYGASALVHDAITQIPGSFEKTLKRMMMFKCAGIQTYFKSVLMGPNKHDMENLMLLSQRLKIEMQMASSIIPSHCGIDPDALRLNETEEYYRAYKLFDNHCMAKPVQMVRDLNGPICMCGQTSLSINPYGEIYPCVSMPVSLGNVRTDSIIDVWENSLQLKKIRQISFKDMACHPENCQYKDSCAVCMGSIYDVHSGKIKPRIETCKMAEANSMRTKEEE